MNILNPDPSIKRITLISVIIVLITLAVYGNVRFHKFINFDDDIYVTDNQIVKKGLTLYGVKWALGFNESGYWQPLTWLSHMLDMDVYGLDSGRHHLTNLIIHLANTLLLFWVLFRMTGSVYRSAFVAALFAVHPLNVDSVAWIAERKNLLSTFFCIASLFSYCRFVEKPGPARYTLTLVIFALGLMTKPMLVTLPFVFLLLDFWPFRRMAYIQRQDSHIKKPEEDQAAGHKTDNFKLVIEKIPFIVLSFGSVWLSILSTRHINNMISENAVPITLRITNALVSYVSYIAKMIWPFQLSVYYPFPQSVPLWQVAGAGILLLAVTWLFLLNLNRRPYFAVGWFWYLGTLVPVIGIVQGGLWPAMADRWAYIPLIGLFVIIAWGAFDIAARWRHGKTALAVLAVSAICCFSLITRTQLQHWENSETLFRHTLAVTLKNPVAHNNLGNALLEKGKAKIAIKHFEAVLALKPDDAKAHNNLGNAFMKMDRVDDAIVHYLESIERAPYVARTHNNLGVAFYKKERVAESIRHLQKALRLKPDYADAYNNLGAAYRKAGQGGNAARCYLKAIQLRSDFAEAYNNLGILLWHQGKLKTASSYFKKALASKPNYKKAQENLKKLEAAQEQYN